jgi:hypothetical protein
MNNTNKVFPFGFYKFVRQNAGGAVYERGINLEGHSPEKQNSSKLAIISISFPSAENN